MLARSSRRIASVAIVAVLLSSDALRAEDKPAPQTRLSVVNVTRVLREFKYANVLGDQLILDAEKGDSKARAAQARIAELKERIGQERDSGRKEELRKELKQLESTVNHDQREYTDRQGAIAAEVYQKIRETVAEIAKERKLDLVLGYPGSRGDNEEMTAASFYRNLGASGAVPLYVASEVDLTGEIVKRLNKRFPARTK
jgi:Skp family chaperone for outer membrane proteins